MWLGRVGARRRMRAGLAAACAALAVAVSLLLVALPSEPGVREKSTPAVSVFARQADRVVLWDGTSLFRPGDAVRFEVFSGGARHVTVVSPARARLYEGAVLPKQRALLPLSFTFDPAPGDETVFVVLSDSPLGDAALEDAVEKQRRDLEVWVIRLLFPKETK